MTVPVIDSDFIGQDRWQVYFAGRLSLPPATASYAFIGPPHIGKRTFALGLARAWLCRQRTNQPCKICDSCRAWGEGLHPDLIFLQRDSSETKIGVEQARAFISALAATPSYAAHRVGILVEAERLTIEAQQVLLKTLEEPPLHVILIVTVSNEGLLLPTVLSRLAQVRFGLVASRVLGAALQKRGVKKQRAEELAELSGGLPGLAIAWHVDTKAEKTYRKTAEDFLQLLKRPLADQFRFTERVATQSEIATPDLLNLLRHWQLLLRHGLLAAAASPDAKNDIAYWHDATQALETVIVRLRRNANRRLALNVFFLTLSKRSFPQRSR